MTMSCTDATIALGSYVLGSLDHVERVAVEAHLNGCQSCRDELGMLAPLPGLLSRLTLEEAVSGPPPVDDAMLERLLRKASADRRAARQRRWLAVAAAAVIVTGGSAAGVAGWNASHATHWQQVSAAAGPVHMHLDLVPASGGTTLQLHLRGVPRDERCRLIAVSDTGARDVAGSWEATYSGTASIRGTTWIPRAHLRSVIIETYGGDRLVSAAIPQSA
jgi:predicted anti-sigma-YlaC factor YlaD